MPLFIVQWKDKLPDGPAIRAIVRRAQADDYRFSALILGLVNSPPFQMRRTSTP